MKHAILVFGVLALASVAGTSLAQDLPRGMIVDNVQCRDNPAQHYALYLPTSFTPTRKWPVIFGFDAGGRGQRAVERYQEAAEKYGYIVVGSNNSKNGPWEPILAAAAAMRHDVETRFPIDPKRRYTAGMSGGARVSMKLALSGNDIAGVLASSAGFPDDDFKDTLRFPLFGTMGTEDFNYDEMQRIDVEVKSPHRIEMFEGGHQWPPIELATDGVEYMEIQAMKQGTKRRDPKLVEQLFAKRMAQAEAKTNDFDKMRELIAVAADFKGLRDVGAVSGRASALGRQQSVQQEGKAEAAEETREKDLRQEVFDLLDQAADINNTSKEAFAKLKAHVIELAGQSQAAQDSVARRFSRRLLTEISAEVRSLAEGDQQVLDAVKQVRTPVPVD